MLIVFFGLIVLLNLLQALHNGQRTALLHIGESKNPKVGMSLRMLKLDKFLPEEFEPREIDIV